MIENAVGTIVKVGDLGYGITPDSDTGTRYALDKLDPPFQQDGLRVRFSGVLNTIPSNERRWGIPFTLTHIEKLEE